MRSSPTGRPSRYHLLGYSWGGLLAMLYAIEQPTRIGSLALVSPAPITAAGRRAFESRFAERMRSPRIVEERAALVASDLRSSDPDAFRHRAFDLSVAGYFHDFARVRQLTPFRVTGRTQTAVWESLGEYDLERALGAISARARIFHGRHDAIPLETAEATARLLRADLVTFEQSGHCPHVEEPARFRRQLDGWLPSR